MADFVAVLRKTIGALGDNSPEMRERVYEKARATIEAKLAAINPPPPAVVIERQKKALEDAIAVIRAEYDGPPPAKADELDEVLASLDAFGTVAPQSMPRTTPVFERLAPVKPESQPAEREAADPAVGDGAAVAAKPPVSPDPAPNADPAQELVENVEPKSPAIDTKAVAAAVAGRKAAARRRPQGRGRGGLIAALAVLLAIVAAGGYAIWSNRDDFSRMVGLGPSEPAQPSQEPVTTADEPDGQQEDVAAATPAETDRAAPAAPEAEPAAAPAPGEPQKFTQRLLADGREVDEGPAGGERSIGEGTTVAAAAQPAPSGTATDAPAATPAEPSAPAASEPASPSVAVGQRATFLEEQTSLAQSSAENGSVVWSVVNESPGGDLPPEPAIRAEAVIPGKDLQLRMTIRRNGDQTLPAAHIVEMIFLTPDGFEGGGITNVSRINFKETEEVVGNPLIGIPAKIADGFFLIALGDSQAEVEENTRLLQRQNWLDIPILYQSGRRALLTMEKGIPGERVFADVLRAWAEASG